MKQKVIQIITSILLIITLTMANFLLLCVNAVSYAVDTINAEENTNHKNVLFMAYFKDANGNKITQNETLSNNQNLKIYFQITVKREGYFNGNIILNNANFKLKNEILNDVISKIENNNIYLNQINAGENVEIEAGIELLNDEQFDLNLIDLSSEISIEGIYRDSKQKDISIKAKRNITLNIFNPYKTANEGLVLTQDIITNKILNYNGEDKRVIQIQVEVGPNNNLFPVQKTEMDIQVLKISNKEPENILVNSNNTLVTNGKEFNKEDWNYDSKTGLIKINIDNNKENGKVSWIKDGLDNFIITYIFDKDIEINKEKSIVSSKIKFYDTNNTVVGISDEMQISKQEKDTIVTSKIYQSETSIYKGKLYAGIQRDITYVNKIDLNLNNVASEINIEENNQTMGDKNLNSVYKITKINEAEIKNVLGEKGNLNIINAKNGKVISTINKDTEGDENGDIIISYPEGVEEITFRIISDYKIGKLEIENTKTINSNDKNIVEVAKSINSTSVVSYISNNIENRLDTTESTIELRETETSVDLQISRTELSAMTSNDNVEFRITLNSRDEKNELYKNPVLRLELPEKIEDIQVNSIKLVYEDELNIQTAALNGKNIEIVLNGEQTKYKEEAIEGAIILVNANLKTSAKIPSSTEQIKLTYTNDNAVNYKDNTNTTIKNIDIVSYAGIVTTNQISEYGIEVVNNDGVESAELEIANDTKKVTIEKKIINNKENKISDVRILGVFPTKEAIDSNNIDIEVGSISVFGIDESRVKIYYSNNANATEDIENEENNWIQNIENNKDVKKYLVIIDELELLEGFDLTYQIVIPSNLEYNESAEEGYTVYYKNTTVEEQVNTKYIKLATSRYDEVYQETQNQASNEVQTEFENKDLRLELKFVDSENGALKSGYGYRYVLYITNKTDKDMKNVKVTIDASDILNISEIYYIDSNEKAVMKENANNIEISKISSGETIEVAIYTTVSLFKDSGIKDVSVMANVNIDGKDYNSNKVNEVAKSNFLLNMDITSDNDGNYVESGDSIKYNVAIKNEGKDTVNLVTLNNWISNQVTLSNVTKNGEELSSDDYSLKVDSNKNQKLLKLQEISIPAGERVEIGIETVTNLLYGNANPAEVISEYSLEVDSVEIGTTQLKHILQPDITTSSYSENNRNVKNGESGSGNILNPQTTSEYKIISGTAWIDENENGQKDENEKTFEGMNVKLLNTKTNEFVKDLEGKVMTATTTSTGFYSFGNMTSGQYLVIFEYDNTKYGLTTFEKEEIANELNSNVITKTINVDGVENKVAATEVLNVENNNISNINIGLVMTKKYDLKLDKYISKVTVQNNKTTTHTYTDATLVKEEIDAKQVDSTIVVVEYKIKVTNNGDVSAYARKIVDYLAVDYKFNSELNKDWYQSGSNVYCTSLANEEIKPGESREVTLTVIKELTENNTGLITNTAEIVNSYNELGLTDINSTEGNKIKGEDDMSSADLIISIRTGQVVMTIVLIISTIILLGIVGLFMKKNINKKLI